MNKNKFFSILILIGMTCLGFLLYQFKYVPYKKAKIEAEELKVQQEIAEAKAPKFVKQEIEKVQLTNAQKIDELRNRKNHYKVITLSNYSKAYFNESGNVLELVYADNKIGNFGIENVDDLNVLLVEGTDSDLFIKVGSNKFYYNSFTNETLRIDLNVGVKYVKTGKENTLLFVTEKGTFIYNKFDKDLEYFSYFTDFVYFNDGYIGVVNIEDTRILNNLGYSEETQNLIVYYNPSTKEKNIVKKTDEKIEQIFVFNKNVFIKNKNGELFKVENI